MSARVPTGVTDADSRRAAEPPAAPRGSWRRALSRSRWDEYRALLDGALARGYAVVSLEAWLDQPERWRERPLLLLRHDVDQHPRTAMTMADVEREFGLTSTWYFRWRTASSELIAELRRRGHAVGLHYETLSRQARAGDVGRAAPDALLGAARDVLRGEIGAFAARYGAIASVCPHDDPRAPGIDNAVLLTGEDLASYGVRYDAVLAMRERGLTSSMTDSDGGWAPGSAPELTIGRGLTPLLCIVHPNHWTSAASLGRDRVLSRVLPATGHDPAARPWPLRSGTDDPPI